MESKLNKIRQHLPSFIVWAGIVFALIYRFRWINDQIFEWHSWRQSETLMMIEAYYRYGIDLLRPQVGWLGDYRTYPFEFPITQASIAFLWSLFGNQVWIGKVVYLMLFVFGCPYLYLLVALNGTYSWARWSLLCYLIMPISVYYSIGLQVDFFEITSCLGLLYHAQRYKESGRVRDVVLFGLWFLVAGLEKPPYLLGVGFGTAYLYLKNANWKRLGWLVVATLPGLVGTLGWIYYSGKLMHEGPPLLFLPGFDRNLDVFLWYFGTFSQRLDPENWYLILNRCLLAFSFLMVAASLAGLLWKLATLRGANNMWIWVTCGTLVMTLLIFNLQIWHDYYQIPFVLPIAVFAGYAVSKIETHSPVLAILFGFFLAYFSIQTMIRSKMYFVNQTGIDEVGMAIQRNTKPEELILILNQPNPSNDPIIHAAARRFGYSIAWEGFKVEYLDSVLAHRVHTAVVVNRYSPLDPEVELRLAPRASEITPIGFKVDVYDIRPSNKGRF